MFVVKLSSDVTRGDLWPAGQVRGGRVAARRWGLQLAAFHFPSWPGRGACRGVSRPSNGPIIDARTPFPAVSPAAEAIRGRLFGRLDRTGNPGTRPATPTTLKSTFLYIYTQ